MTIDKQKLQKLLWSEVAAWKADCGGWKQNAEALGEFLGNKTVEEVALELLAENERLAAGGQLLVRDRDELRAERDQLKAENEALRKMLVDASEEVATWGAYASEYFQEKHNLAGCVAKFHDAAIGTVQP